MLIPNMILKKCHMYILVFVFCFNVTKSKQISKIIVATCCFVRNGPPCRFGPGGPFLTNLTLLGRNGPPFL